MIFCFLGSCLSISGIILFPSQINLHFKDTVEFYNYFKQKDLAQTPIHGELTDRREASYIKETKIPLYNTSLLHSTILNLSQDTEEKRDTRKESGIGLNYNVHVFYYAWYDNPKHDGRYMHWNHEYIPHWKWKTKDEGKYKYPSGVSHQMILDQIFIQFLVPTAQQILTSWTNICSRYLQLG